MEMNWEERLSNLKYDHIWQMVILPFYKESFDIISASIESLINAKWPASQQGGGKDKMIIILAYEERAGKEAEENARRVHEKYKDKFAHFINVKHPRDLPGEMAGKGSNIAYAAEEARKRVLNTNNIKYDEVLVSAFDIDTRVYPQYFFCLTWHFLTSENPFRSSFQPVPVYNNNIWDAPAIMRIVATGSAFWHLIESSRRERLRTFSSHSMSFDTLVKVDYWRTDVVNEDSMIFWQCFFHFNGDYQVQPIFIPVSMDTCLAETYIQSFVNQYKQKRRWGYNVEYFPWLFINMIRKKKIPLWTRFIQTYRYVEGNYSWTTGVMIITFFGWFPLIFGDFTGFSRTTMAFTFPSVVRGAMTLALIGLLVQSVISTLLLPKRPGGHSRLKYIFMVAQWVLQPIAGVFFGAIPAIDAQTRLMLGKYMHFFVTSKARRNKEGKIVEGGSDSLTLTRSR